MHRSPRLVCPEDLRSLNQSKYDVLCGSFLGGSAKFIDQPLANQFDKIPNKFLGFLNLRTMVSLVKIFSDFLK